MKVGRGEGGPSLPGHGFRFCAVKFGGLLLVFYYVAVLVWLLRSLHSSSAKRLSIRFLCPLLFAFYEERGCGGMVKEGCPFLGRPKGLMP